MIFLGSVQAHVSRFERLFNELVVVVGLHDYSGYTHTHSVVRTTTITSTSTSTTTTIRQSGEAPFQQARSLYPTLGS